MGIVVLVMFLWGSTSEDRGQAKRTGPGERVKRVHKLRGSGNVDGQFMEKIQGLLKIVIPSYTCKEAKYVTILTLLLILRTQMSIWLADV